MIRKSRFFEKLVDGQVMSLLSARGEIIPEGGVDFCGTYKNIGSELFQMNYGMVTAAKAVKFNELFRSGVSDKTALVLGFAGDPLRTDFDDHWDLSQLPVMAQKESGREAANRLVSDVGTEYTSVELVETALAHSCEGLIFGYTDPVASLDFVTDTSALAKKRGIACYWVTNGYISDFAFNETKALVDGILVRLYSNDRAFYKKHCKGRIEVVYGNIRKFHDSGVHIEISTTLIEGENDNDATIGSIAGFIKSLDSEMCWLLAGFSPTYRMIDKPQTSMAQLEHARDIALASGLKSVSIVV